MLHSYTLKNGIPVFIVESHSSPVVSIQAWICRGSAHEPESLAGISHFLEHSLFKGTKRRKVGQIADEIESRGGEINAYTSFEETVYYATLASRFFDQGLDVITDAIQHPAFDAQEMIREREVILEEIRRAQDSPFKMVATRLWGSLYAGTPFGRPVLGFEETVKKIDASKLRQYFNKHYNASTTALVIVGDVDAQKAFQKVEKKFSNSKPTKRAFRITKLAHKPSKKAKILDLEKDIQECQLQLGWVSPNVTDPILPALDLACTALGQGESSRFYQTLVKQKQLALSAHFGLTATPSCGLMAITLVTAPEKMETAIREALAVIDQAVREGLTMEELERVKTALEADVVGAKETVEGYARRLGHYYHQFHDPQYESRYLEQVLAVDVDSAVDALARFIQTPPTLSLAHPKGFSFDKKAMQTVLESRPNVVHTEEVPTLNPVKRLSGGKILIKTTNTLPVLSMRWIFPGGSREESSQHFGLTNLFQRTWMSGTKTKTSLQIAHQLESLGASCFAFAGRHSTGLSFECLRKHWPTLQGLFREVLLEPTFPEEEIQIEKDLILREILSERDSPGSICQLNFTSALYGDHPYGRSFLGTKETVNALSRKELQTYFRNFIHRGNLVVSMVGALDESFWNKEIRTLFESLPQSGKQAASTMAWTTPSQLKVTTAVKQPLFQSHVLIGFAAASMFEPERYALKLLSSCLAGQGGRLFMELRDKQSLAYTVAPMSSDSPERGMFGVYIGCAPDKLPRALSGIRLELGKVVDRAISSRELERAKHYLLGRYELEMQRYLSQAMTYGMDEFYGLGHDHWQKVPAILHALTVEDLRAAANKYFAFDRAVLSIVHPEPLKESTVAEMWNPKAKKRNAPPLEARA